MAKNRITMRSDGRRPNDLRPVSFQANYVLYPEGSVLVSAGNTKVLCNVSIEEGVPAWMKNERKSGGWVTAEYSMLPRATHIRTGREAALTSGRTQEIRRLIGRALRSAVNLEKLGPRTCIVDCDVLQADGGTRTAAITGGYVALCLALRKLNQAGVLPRNLIRCGVAAISAGIVRGIPMVDLCYSEDSAAETDANFVMDSTGKIIEIQGTAEKKSFPRQDFIKLLNLAQRGIVRLLELQKRALAGGQERTIS